MEFIVKIEKKIDLFVCYIFIIKIVIGVEDLQKFFIFEILLVGIIIKFRIYIENDFGL